MPFLSGIATFTSGISPRTRTISRRRICPFVLDEKARSPTRRVYFRSLKTIRLGRLLLWIEKKADFLPPRILQKRGKYSTVIKSRTKTEKPYPHKRKTYITFIITITGLALRIFITIKTVPVKGISGYLISLLVSQLLVTCFSYICYKKLILKMHKRT